MGTNSSLFTQFISSQIIRESIIYKMCLKSHGTDVNIFRFKTNYMASPQVQCTFSSFSTMLLCTAEKIPLGVVSSVVTALKKNPAGNVNIFILTFS